MKLEYSEEKMVKILKERESRLSPRCHDSRTWNHKALFRSPSSSVARDGSGSCDSQGRL